jgi:hypothetical protein
VSILPKNIYIYNRVKIRHGEEGGGESGEDEKRERGLFLRELNADFPQEYIYIYNGVKMRHDETGAREGDQGWRGV